MKTDSHPAPRQLYDLREWLLDRIDGGEEMRGEDSLISGFIRQIDALEARVLSLMQPKTIAEWQAAKSSSGTVAEIATVPSATAALPQIALKDELSRQKSRQNGGIATI